MKRENFIWAAILLMIIGCGESKRHFNETDGFITVDVTMKYPKKDLILQDFMDVEYVALETNDDFVCQGIVLAVGREIILVKNQLNDGNLYVFDRRGKGLRKINRKGNGAEEYPFLSDITLDEENNEMFINCINKLLVYDLFGNFKRSLLFREGSSYNSICNYNKENLICFDRNFDNKEESIKSPFIIISKKEGRIIKDISIISQQKLPDTKRINLNDMVVVAYGAKSPYIAIIPYKDNWILTVYSSDTLFRYLPDENLIPFMVRAPSIESKEAESFLAPVILTDHYYFLQAEKMEPEVKGNTPQEATVFYPKTYLVYDRKEKSIFEYSAYNKDYTNKAVDITQEKGNDEIAFWRKIEAHELLEANKNGQLKDGKLKEIAKKLDEDDNPVIMLVKHK